MCTVRCEDLDFESILAAFPTKIATFPGKYLGLPLHYRNLRRVHMQPLIDKTTTKLPG
jgi:hypothetical protein